MTYGKRAVLGLLLLILAAFAVYSFFMVLGARRREPERAKLVMAECEAAKKALQTGGAG